LNGEIMDELEVDAEVRPGGADASVLALYDDDCFSGLPPIHNCIPPDYGCGTPHSERGGNLNPYDPAF
jgi:hypothetical protein